MQEPTVDPREAAGLAVLDACARDEAVLYARRARQLVASARLSAELEEADGLPRALVLDLAGTLRVGQRAAEGQLAEATRLVEDFPLLLAQLVMGAVLVPQARKVIERTWGLSVQVAREVDRRLGALWQDPAAWAGQRFTRALTRIMLQTEAELEPAATERRHAEARAGRRVTVTAEPDGMGSVFGLLPADDLLVFARGLDALTARQRTADRAAGLVRTADQRRADVLAALPGLALHLLQGAAPLGPPAEPGPVPPGGCTHPRIVLEVQVPMATLLGHSDAPGHLVGYGPLSAHQVRLLLPDAHLRQVLVDATTGQVLSTSDRLVPPARAAAPPRTGAAPAPAPGTPPARPRRARRRPSDGPPHVRWLGGPEDRPERLTEHLAPEGSAAAADAPSPADLARLRALVPTDVLVVADEPEEQYRPSAPLDRLLRLRDELCTGPGCGVCSRRSDLDHADPWPHGPTNAANMRPHSRRCHRAKTFTWRTCRTPDGTVHWTSPTGRTYRVAALWQPAPALRRRRAAAGGAPRRNRTGSTPEPVDVEDHGLAATWRPAPGAAGGSPPAPAAPAPVGGDPAPF